VRPKFWDKKYAPDKTVRFPINSGKTPHSIYTILTGGLCKEKSIKTKEELGE
jgi:hypothetical protein